MRGRDREEFVVGLAEHWGEINSIHSFREGNTRTQFVFFSELARHAGYETGHHAVRRKWAIARGIRSRSLLQSIHHPNRPPRRGAEQGIRWDPATGIGGVCRSQRTHAHRSPGFSGTADHDTRAGRASDRESRAGSSSSFRNSKGRSNRCKFPVNRLPQQKAMLVRDGSPAPSQAAV
ncbi:Fic family protein [Rhodococcus erythropolis]|uniref:Fic family protein n=1 Tax=Rhodococcus erythropolis TaxID=1833 RepID=UPI001187342B